MIVESNSSWLLSRVGARLLSALAGGLAGWGLGEWLGYPTTLAFAGAGVAVLTLSVADTLKGNELLDWLRNPDADPPELPGLWGEVAHRIRRLVIQRNQAVTHERARLDQFLSAIEVSPNGVMLLDETDHIVWLSSVAADHFGLNARTDLQQRVTNLVRYPSFVQYLAAGDYREPVKCVVARGALTHMQVHVRVYGEGMKLVVSQDISERERADTMRRDFVANVSHEIRTPLTVLSGFIETMATLSLTEVERKRVIELMTQQAARMQTLVADLLTLAQIEGSPRPASDRWMSLEAMLRRIESDGLALSAGRHRLAFHITDAVGLSLSGVETEWLSAMGNLVSNAIRYTPEGGAVEVSWVSRADGGGEFRVKDTGIGIAPEHLPRLTERFYRVDGSRSRDTGGTGLGLSIVKHVIQRHGGELKVTSEPGKGSVFSLTVPPTRVRSAEAD
ncbi:phosphate regulon sensor histidine kinase PhoR [Aquabacterium fontiphilum]|uniref:phosphate regulon sensor histidine kinase PhoR n=1 Tax=Aquabacterium fontiphilum TaxID=450365 RepID=UPI002ED23591